MMGTQLFDQSGRQIFLGDIVDPTTGQSGAMKAAEIGDLEELRSLGDRHANFNLQDHDGWTALFYAVFTALKISDILYHVGKLTAPVAGSENTCWKTRTLFSVLGPKIPSTDSFGMSGKLFDILLSCDCITRTF